MLIDREFTLRTLQELVRIDSRNPGLEEGAPGESEIAAYVERLLARMGWAPVLHGLGDGRVNVVASRAGTQGGRSLMINAHLDTVGVAGMSEPFAGTERDGRIWGRGAQDIKGGVAAVLGAARALADHNVGLHGDLVLTFVADEEHNSIGTEDVLRRITTDAAIVIEPSDLDVCIAHRGVGVFRLSTRGKTAHGGSTHLGIDANVHMARLLVEVDRLGRSWRRQPAHPMLGTPSLHIPLISGGRQLFMYAGACEAHVECRLIPGQTQDGVAHELQGIVDRLGREIDGFQGSLECTLWRPPYEIDDQRPIVRTVLDAAQRVRGKPARAIGHSWWEDSGLLGDAGIDTVVIGPRGDGLHTDVEWVDTESVIQLSEIIYESVLAYCVAGKVSG